MNAFGLNLRRWQWIILTYEGIFVIFIAFFAHDWKVFWFWSVSFVCPPTLYFYDTTCSKTSFSQSLIGIIVLHDRQLICEVFNIQCRLQFRQLWSSIPIPSFKLRESTLWPLTHPRIETMSGWIFAVEQSGAAAVVWMNEREGDVLSQLSLVLQSGTSSL